MASLRSLLACVVACLCSCSAPLTDDEKMTRALVGKWSQITQMSEARDELTIALEADGRIAVAVKRHAASGPQMYAAKGNWRVDGGNFVCKLASDGPPDMVTHLDGRHRVLAVGEFEWVMEWVYGNELRAWRYPK